MKIAIDLEQKGYIVKAIEERQKRIFEYSSNMALLSVNDEIPPINKKMAILEIARQDREYAFLTWLLKNIDKNNLVLIEVNEGSKGGQNG